MPAFLVYKYNIINVYAVILILIYDIVMYRHQSFQIVLLFQFELHALEKIKFLRESPDLVRSNFCPLREACLSGKRNQSR